MSLSTASNWLWNFGIGYVTPYLVDPSTTGPDGIKAADLGAKVFFIWGSMCLGCLVFTYFFIPETKGLSLEQIDLMYQHTTPRKSLGYRKVLLENDVRVAAARDGDVDVEKLHRTHTGEKDASSAERRKRAVTPSHHSNEGV